MSLTIEDVIAELDRAGRPINHQPGENGVTTTCPLCPQEMTWVEGWLGWICDGGCEPSRIADALHLA